MKFKIYFVVLLLLFTWTTNAQTNVSGGIFSNTTWTLVNSPYIVIDTVVVFPGVTLTIEPGVTIKFENDKYLEIRQATILAIGTINDSITFTSNSSSPIPGIWSQVFMHLSLPSQFNYCHFKYAHKAIENISIPNKTIVKNSKFDNNYIGFSSSSSGNYCLVDSCYFVNNTYGINYGYNLRLEHSIVSNNQTGIYASEYAVIKDNIIDSNSVTGIWTYNSDSIINCDIKYNGIGLECGASDGPNVITNNTFEYNNIGIKLHWKLDKIYCNKLCSNLSYDLYYDVSVYNCGAENNYWCTTDSAIVASRIYDGHDNLSLALITYMPIDTQQCYIINEIPTIESGNNFSINPNPFNNYLNISFPESVSNGVIRVFNIVGELEKTFTVNEGKNDIDLSTLSRGIHVVEISTGNYITRQKIIKQ